MRNSFRNTNAASVNDVLVRHSLMSSPHGTREVVILISMIKDGKISRLETGATSLD